MSFCARLLGAVKEPIPTRKNTDPVNAKMYAPSVTSHRSTAIT
jgi:hypothetical protein